MTTALTSETIHASCIALSGRALLIAGPSGSGKSDLALRLIDRGATLISDDYTILTQVGQQLMAHAPETIKGKIEVRGLGIMEMEATQDVPVALIIDLSEPSDRFPLEPKERLIAGLRIPIMGLRPFEATAPIKAELALSQVIA
jgi:serine kinase of HPr protein (carbohydrate metabolism regulator)